MRKETQVQQDTHPNPFSRVSFINYTKMVMFTAKNSCYYNISQVLCNTSGILCKRYTRLLVCLQHRHRCPQCHINLLKWPPCHQSHPLTRRDTRTDTFEKTPCFIKSYLGAVRGTQTTGKYLNPRAGTIRLSPHSILL